MDGYEVDVEALRKAAKAATSAGEQAGRVKLGEAVSPVAEAMPLVRVGTIPPSRWRRLRWTVIRVCRRYHFRG